MFTSSLIFWSSVACSSSSNSSICCFISINSDSSSLLAFSNSWTFLSALPWELTRSSSSPWSCLRALSDSSNLTLTSSKSRLRLRSLVSLSLASLSAASRSVAMRSPANFSSDKILSKFRCFFSNSRTLDLWLSNSRAASSSSVASFLFDLSSLSLMACNSSSLWVNSSMSFMFFFFDSSRRVTSSDSSSAFFLASDNWPLMVNSSFSSWRLDSSSSSSCSWSVSLACSTLRSLEFKANFWRVSSSSRDVASCNWDSMASEVFPAKLARFSASVKAVVIWSISAISLDNLSELSLCCFSASCSFIWSSAHWDSSCFRRRSFSCLLPETDFNSLIISLFSCSSWFLVFSSCAFNFLSWSSSSFFPCISWECLCLISAMVASWLTFSSSKDFFKAANSFSLAVLNSCWAAVESSESKSSFFKPSSSSLSSRTSLSCASTSLSCLRDLALEAASSSTLIMAWASSSSRLPSWSW